jgi:hypothetical protein
MHLGCLIGCILLALGRPRDFKLRILKHKSNEQPGRGKSSAIEASKLETVQEEESELGRFVHVHPASRSRGPNVHTGTASMHIFCHPMIQDAASDERRLNRTCKIV